MPARRWQCGWLKVEMFPGMWRVVVRHFFKVVWFRNGAGVSGDLWVGVRGLREARQLWPPRPRVHGGRKRYG